MVFFNNNYVIGLNYKNPGLMGNVMYEHLKGIQVWTIRIVFWNSAYDFQKKNYIDFSCNFLYSIWLCQNCQWKSWQNNQGMWYINIKNFVKLNIRELFLFMKISWNYRYGISRPTVNGQWWLWQDIQGKSDVYIWKATD